MNLPTLDDLGADVSTVLLRADLNVPLEAGPDGAVVVADDYRILQSLPTIQELRSRGLVVVVASHLGRPSGPDASLRMDPVAARLGELGGFQVRKVDDVAGDEAAAAVAAAEPGQVIVLENTRFEAGEKQNDADLVDRLAALADAFVLDAFGSAHRAHASTVGIAERVPSVAGRLLQRELDAFGRLLEGPDRPFVVVLGGAKVADKLAVIQHLLPKVDAMLIGGGMCFSLLAAQGHEIGDSLLDAERVPVLRELLDSPDGDKILLPTDIVVAEEFAADALHRVVPATAIPGGTIGLDVGPETAARFAGVITDAADVFWNGPMGVFEWGPFRSGTVAVAEAVAATPAHTIIGGGDSVAAVRELGLEDGVDHVSTGGGAGLELLEGRELPGVAALAAWV